MSTLRYSYDSESDCGYIRIGDGEIARTESLTASLHVDRDGSDNIVGIEALTVTDPSWVPQSRTSSPEASRTRRSRPPVIPISEIPQF